MLARKGINNIRRSTLVYLISHSLYEAKATHNMRVFQIGNLQSLVLLAGLPVETVGGVKLHDQHGCLVGY